jgi:hypothetical protein
MLKFIANLFGKRYEAPTAPAPYKVEEPGAVKPAAKPAKKPTVQKATTAKPRKPRTPKAQ